ncbi:hypothetical protein [Holospora curviuscula]|uniref:Tc1-like transposase DDE domain-containing protein n=1 Tax=Holospora curviuscula TaxID=1082868 RepID=A0A2S5R7G3_9PROT|nr:hypothetical protein [Holospora curviuscula]PPE03233.1 hypothetical protein HCUR_01325 [Holospora curviuscula]
MGSTFGKIRLFTDPGEVLMCWVEKTVLTNIPGNFGIVLDNPVFHKGKAMQKMIKDSGHTLPTSLFS